MRRSLPTFSNIRSIDEFQKITDKFSKPAIIGFEPKLDCFTQIIEIFPDIEKCFSSLLVNRIENTVSKHSTGTDNKYKYIFDLFIHRGNLVVEKNNPKYHEQLKIFAEKCNQLPLLQEKLKIGEEVIHQPGFDARYNKFLQFRGVQSESLIQTNVIGVPVNIHPYFSNVGNIVTPLHVDPEIVSNMTYQLHGKKEWILFDPKYQSSINHLMIKGFSIIENAIEHIEHYYVPIEEGQLLFIPKNWPHTVRQSHGKNLSIGCFIFEQNNN
jgi:hypothetical protein